MTGERLHEILSEEGNKQGGILVSWAAMSDYYGVYNRAAERVTAEIAAEAINVDPKAVFEIALNLPKKDRQALYELLYNDGNRINR